MTRSNRRPREGRKPEIRIPWESLPETPQEAAFKRVSAVMGLTHDMIDFIVEADGGEEEKIYWAALIEAVASCAIGGSAGRVWQVMSDGAIQELHRAANDDEQPATFLQDFANQTLITRASMTGDPQTVDADELFRHSIDHFAPYDDIDERALQTVHAHTDGAWAKQLATIARNMPPAQ